MTDKDWWKPKNLKMLEEVESSKEDITGIDTGGDFGSYKVMLELGDLEKSQIRSHNDIQPRYRVRTVKRLLGGLEPLRVLDAGCGLGFTTNELKRQFPNAKVYGVDVSSDAIKFARANFPDCEFDCFAIDPDSGDFEVQFDLILAFEFYPFTRTSDLKEHVRFIRYLLSLLSSRGKLVIYQLWNNDESLSVNYDKLKSGFSPFSFSSYPVPVRTVGTLVPFYPLALGLSSMLRRLLYSVFGRKVGENKCIVVGRSLN